MNNNLNAGLNNNNRSDRFLLLWLFSGRQLTRSQKLSVSLLACAAFSVFCCYPYGRVGNWLADAFAVSVYILLAAIIILRVWNKVTRRKEHIGNDR